MKMQSIFITILLALLMATTVSAQSAPIAVVAKVSACDASAYQVVVTNTITSDTASMYPVNGEAVIDLSRMSFQEDDRITISVNGQTQWFNMEYLKGWPDPPLDAFMFNFDISDCAPAPTECQTKSCGTCSSGGTCSIPDDVTPYASCDSCCPTPDTPVCDPVVVCDEPTDCPTLPATEGDLLVYLLGLGAVATAGIGSWFASKKWTRTSDTDAFLAELKKYMTPYTGFRISHGADKVYGTHKHPGITGYHDPNTSHSDFTDRHPRGKLTPKYVKNSDNKWVYGGS